MDASTKSLPRRFRTLIASFIWISSFVFSSPDSMGQDDPGDESSSTALDIYQLAHEQLQSSPIYDAFKTANKEQGARWYLTVPLDGFKTLGVDSVDRVIQRIQEAKKYPEGEWTDPTQLKEFSNIKRMVLDFIVVMTLQSRLLLEQGDEEGAIHRLLECMTIPQLLGENPIFISKLVEIALDQIAVANMAHFLPLFSKETLSTLPEKISQLPEMNQIRNVFESEYRYGQQLMKAQPEIYTPELMAGYPEFWKSLLELAEMDPIAFKPRLKRLGDDHSEQFMVKGMLPAIQKMHESLSVQKMHHDMLELGIRVLLKGTEEVKSSRDPFLGKPFEIETSENGFHLISKLERQNKRVQLRFGH